MANQELTQAVQAALDGDKNLRAYGLEAKANGSVVTVTGIVDVLAEKEHVQRLLQSVPGVEEVDNAVTISTDGQIDDGDVRFEVGEELGLYPEDELRELSIESSGGVVTLQGTVSSADLRKKALDAAAKARGVVGVVSKIDVKEG